MNTKLMEGDSVAIISPSATIKDNPEASALCAKGVEVLSSLGLNVIYGKHASGKQNYKAGAIAERISDIEDAYKDPKVKAIICTQGGDNSNELLPYIDWDVMRENSKKIFGSSDITVLLNALYAHTGQVSYHGIDLMWGLGKNATQYTVNLLRSCLFSDKLVYNHHPDYPNWKIIRPGTSTGICLGGCLPSFCLLLGTNSDPIQTINKPFILIIESIGESLSRIESYIAQISQQPNFKQHCAGIIIGYFFMCKEQLPENHREISDIVLDYTREFNFPIIEVKELGHAVENMIFPIGRHICIDASASEVTIATVDNLEK